MNGLNPTHRTPMRYAAILALSCAFFAATLYAGPDTEAGPKQAMAQGASGGAGGGSGGSSIGVLLGGGANPTMSGNIVDLGPAGNGGSSLGIDGLIGLRANTHTP